MKTYLPILRPSAWPWSVEKRKWMPALTRESAFSSAACVKLSNERTGFAGSAVEESMENGTRSVPNARLRTGGRITKCD